MAPTVLNIHDIIRNKQVTTFFQPLVSIKKRALLGFEALNRGHLADKDLFIPPQIMFSLADQESCRLDLDRLCRGKSLERFAQVHQRHKNLMLSINLDTSLLDTVAGSNYLIKQVEACRINPNNVIIEIIESDVRDADALLRFIKTYRKLGFLIALDDVGSGHSNLERIASIKPEVIKVDRSLITNIDKEFHKLEVTKSLVGLGQKIGAMVVAEGIEREEEALALLELGVDVFQGFYFCRPFIPGGVDFECPAQVHHIASCFGNRILEKIGARKEQIKGYERILANIMSRLVKATPTEFERKLVESLAANEALECLYILDMHGCQVSNTVCNPYRISENKRFIYQPAQRGADHSLKDYYLPIRAGLVKYITEQYISLASGNKCTTLSATFRCSTGDGFILCLDVGEARNERNEDEDGARLVPNTCSVG
ncbi:MAG: EAL domain-containing protein [Desulfovibrionaceae bacterium]